MGIYQRSGCQASAGRRLAIGLRLAMAGSLASLVASVSAQAPYVPTPPDVVQRMLPMAKVGPSDFVVDLGSAPDENRSIRCEVDRF